MTVKIKQTSNEGFDPTPKVGWLSYLIHRDNTHTYLIVNYKNNVLTLESELGLVFETSYIEHVTCKQYRLELVRDPRHIAPFVKKKIHPELISVSAKE